MTISQETAEKCVDWMRDNAVPAAQARANRIYMEQFLKVRKAELQQQHAEMSVAAQEVAALASPEYREVLEAYSVAIEQDEQFRFLYAAREARFQAWRTQEASSRAAMG